MADAKQNPVTGTRFRGAKGVHGEVVGELSERGKVVARLSCSIPHCTETHLREISDWHQCHLCRNHAPSRSKAKPAAARTKPSKTTSSADSSSPDVVTIAGLVAELKDFCRESGDKGIFDCYAFADYRGDTRDSGGGVVLAVAVGSGPVRLVSGVSSRRSLSPALISLLCAATASKLRVVFGQDHQYSVPRALMKELRLPDEDWRKAMRSLFVEGPFAQHAQDGHAGAFAAAVNASLVAKEKPPYFWSATKSERYGIPRSCPRENTDPSQRRLTEVRLGFPFCRVGDNGSVGGQSIVGIPRLLQLLVECADKNVAVNVWPFDSLSIEDLSDHVAIEPYPSLVRDAGVVQNDANDAIASTTWAQRLDRDGILGKELDLTSLGREQKRTVKIEGWMAGAPCPAKST